MLNIQILIKTQFPSTQKYFYLPHFTILTYQSTILVTYILKLQTYNNVTYLQSYSLHKPQCDLEPSWEDDELDGATIRTINMIHAVTTANKSTQDDDDAPHKTNHFTAPGFCYAFPLLKIGQCYELSIILIKYEV